MERMTEAPPANLYPSLELRQALFDFPILIFPPCLSLQMMPRAFREVVRPVHVNKIHSIFVTPWAEISYTHQRTHMPIVV